MLEESTTAYRRSANEILAASFTDPAKGLTAEQVRSKLAQYGPNQLIGETPVPAWHKFLRQFEDVLTILLLIATVVSAIVWVYERSSPLPYEAIAIFAIVLLNAVMGYMQTERAEQALASLRAMSPAESTVIRDGQRSVVLASDIVPGDLLLIGEGDRIPADARLIDSIDLRTSEAALTGESVPVSKDAAPILVDTQVSDRRNMVFSGTVVVSGRGNAVVVATGMETAVGEIARLLKETPSESTPLQRQLNRTGKLLGLIVIAIAIVITATIILTEHLSKFSALLDVLIFSIALGVAAVPEGLPTVVSVVLSSGVKRMAQRNALIRRLAAVETLGSANVIASDKTGTLTKNGMTVRRIITASGAASISSTGYFSDGDLRSKSGEGLAEAVRFELEQTLITAVCANNAVLKKNNGDWLVQGIPRKQRSL